jgi:hypothetical protein
VSLPVALNTLDVMVQSQYHHPARNIWDEHVPVRYTLPIYELADRETLVVVDRRGESGPRLPRADGASVSLGYISTALPLRYALYMYDVLYREGCAYIDTPPCKSTLCVYGLSYTDGCHTQGERATGWRGDATLTLHGITRVTESHHIVRAGCEVRSWSDATTSTWCLSVGRARWLVMCRHWSVRACVWCVAANSVNCISCAGNCPAVGRDHETAGRHGRQGARRFSTGSS